MGILASTAIDYVCPHMLRFTSLDSLVQYPVTLTLDLRILKRVWYFSPILEKWWYFQTLPIAQYECWFSILHLVMFTSCSCLIYNAPFGRSTITNSGLVRFLWTWPVLFPEFCTIIFKIVIHPSTAIDSRNENPKNVIIKIMGIAH